MTTTVATPPAPQPQPAQQEQPQTLAQWWEENAKHSAVGQLVETADKAMRRNPAMPPGEMWKHVLLPLIKEMHRYHLDYTDAAIEDGSSVDPAYVDALVDYIQEARELVIAQTALLGKALVEGGLLVDGNLSDKASAELKDAYGQCQLAFTGWAARYGDLVEEDTDEDGGEDNGTQVTP